MEGRVNWPGLLVVLEEHRGGVLSGWRIRKGFPKKDAPVVIPESEFQAEKAQQQKQKDV